MAKKATIGINSQVILRFAHTSASSIGEAETYAMRVRFMLDWPHWEDHDVRILFRLPDGSMTGIPFHPDVASDEKYQTRFPASVSISSVQHRSINGDTNEVLVSVSFRISELPSDLALAIRSGIGIVAMTGMHNGEPISMAFASMSVIS